MVEACPRFNGPAYAPARDHDRLAKQHEAIRDLMLDGIFRTLAEIREATGYPEASISAQLRHLRKPRFGRYQVFKQRRTKGTWEYQLQRPVEDVDSSGQMRFCAD